MKTRGHTLLELTIALALGMLIVAAALALYRSQRAVFERASDAARIHDAGVVAPDLLAQQIQMAGFASSANDRIDGALFGCTQAGVTGTDAASASCESLAGKSDGMQVRYAADTVATWPTSANAPTDCLGQAVADAFVINRYYAKASTSSGEPELYCEGSGKQAQPLVEGIERILVTSGWRDRLWPRMPLPRRAMAGRHSRRLMRAGSRLSESGEARDELHQLQRRDNLSRRWPHAPGVLSSRRHPKRDHAHAK